MWEEMDGIYQPVNVTSRTNCEIGHFHNVHKFSFKTTQVYKILDQTQCTPVELHRAISWH